MCAPTAKGEAEVEIKCDSCLEPWSATTTDLAMAVTL